MKTETTKLGQEPAFGFEYSSISKRFYAACAAMQGILANPNASPISNEHYINIVEDAYRAADELLKQENQ